MKTCTKCKIEKPETEFHKNGVAPDGLRTQCKDCLRNYYEQNKEKMIRQRKAYRARKKEERRQQKEEDLKKRLQLVEKRSRAMRHNKLPPKGYKSRTQVRQYIKDWAAAAVEDARQRQKEYYNKLKET